MKRYTVTARKEGKCSKCGQAILKGEQYMYYMASGRPGYYNDASKISWHYRSGCHKDVANNVQGQAN